ncbi:MAG: hypothetical protein JEZ06_06585 [Anaerolineaceae bacterium]|nr:hypothetical protein [Anaerolineaceae bacterium]
MKLQSKSMALIIVFVIFGGIILSAALNLWETESTKTPLKFSSGEASGEYNPIDIRGSYSFGEISTLFEIPIDDLAAAFGVPSDMDKSSFQCKNLEEIYFEEAASGTEIGTASVRLFVALYKGLPFTLLDDTYLLQPALPILRQQGNLDDQQLSFVQSHLVNPNSDLHVPTTDENQDKTAYQNDSENIEHDETEAIVKGKTTYRDLLDWGLTEEEIEMTLGIPMPNPLTLIRDHCAENGLEFGLLKAEFQIQVDNAQQNSE